MNPPLHDPTIYDDLDRLGLSVDLQGWHSARPVFRQVIEATRPQVVVEVGSWKGASAVHMLGLDSRFHLYCVDTWLGSREIWANAHLREVNPRKHGYPQVYFQFLYNIAAAGYAPRVTPLPMASRLGAEALKAAGVVADAIYIDASHDYLDVWWDLRSYWEILRPGGIIFGDDWTWPGVNQAVDQFGDFHSLALEVKENNHWLFTKPAEPTRPRVHAHQAQIFPEV